MKALLRNLFPAATVLILIQLASAQIPRLTPFSADVEISSTLGDRGPRDVEGKIFLTNGHMRMNFTSAGHESAIITDFATKTVDILMPQQQMYMEQKAVCGSDSKTNGLRPYDPENPCANQPNSTCKNIGGEEVSGRHCDHWEVTTVGKGLSVHIDSSGTSCTPADKTSVTVSDVWIDQKLHFPIKTVSENSTILLSNIKEGEPDASLFLIPADYRKMDMGGMMPPGTMRPPQQ